MATKTTFLAAMFITGFLIAPVALRASDPGSCPNDSKLLNDGPTSVFGDGPGTWWGLILDGLQAARIDDEDEQIAYLNQVFGTTFDNLDDLKDFNLGLVEDGWDKNGNGYVCAYELRGARAYYDNPLLNLTFFGISDDQIKNNAR
jgi:hypothetical protein